MPIAYPVRMAKSPRKRAVKEVPLVDNPARPEEIAANIRALKEKMRAKQGVEAPSGPLPPAEPPKVAYPPSQTGKIKINSAPPTVNEQGVPLKTGKGGQSVSNPTYAPMPRVKEDQPVDTGYGDAEEMPHPIQSEVPDFNASPFHEVDSKPYPLQDLGADARKLLEPGGMAMSSDPAHSFAEATTEGGGARHPMAQKAHQIMQAAQQSMQRGSMNKGDEATLKTGIPVGHFRVDPLLPGANPHSHVLKVHYPQGSIWQYRAKLNDDDTGYDERG